MALDSTVAGTNADSYLSVADADALAAADLGPEADAWRALSNAMPADVEQKERALKRATREIDAYLRSGWARYVSGQALLFPRLIDYRGTPAVPFVPTDIQRATYEQATFVLKNKDVLDYARTRRARDVQSASEPNLAFTERSDGGTTPVVSDAALLYLERYRRAGGSRRIRSARLARGWI